MDASSLPPVGLPAASTATAGPSGTAGTGAGLAPRTKSKAYQTTIAAEAGTHPSPHLHMIFHNIDCHSWITFVCCIVGRNCSSRHIIGAVFFWKIDDLKYESKYKELKKKVREVEEVRKTVVSTESYEKYACMLTSRWDFSMICGQDNEQLYVKVLQAQQNIQRLRLERA
jgi:hypothetical protein